MYYCCCIRYLVYQYTSATYNISRRSPLMVGVCAGISLRPFHAISHWVAHDSKESHGRHQCFYGGLYLPYISCFMRYLTGFHRTSHGIYLPYIIMPFIGQRMLPHLPLGLLRHIISEGRCPTGSYRCPIYILSGCLTG